METVFVFISVKIHFHLCANIALICNALGTTATTTTAGISIIVGQKNHDSDSRVFYMLLV
jgi:hypothetical protein